MPVDAEQLGRVPLRQRRRQRLAVVVGALIVDLRGHGFQMVRADANFDQAEVVNRQTWGDGTVGQPVGDAVNGRGASSDAELAVALGLLVASPQLALLCLVHLRPESGLLRGGKHVRLISG